jgi:hypothetical protein
MSQALWPTELSRRSEVFRFGLDVRGCDPRVDDPIRNCVGCFRRDASALVLAHRRHGDEMGPNVKTL